MTKLVLAMVMAAFCTTGFLKSSYRKTVAGQQVLVCVYQVGNDKVEVTQSAFKQCELSKEFCF
jgi:hypothetical protein